MKKAFIIIPILFLASCSDNSSNSNSNSSLIVRKVYTIDVYQVYEDGEDTNNWKNPKYDIGFKFYSDQEISIINLEKSFSPDLVSSCYSYLYFIAFDFKNIESTKVPSTFYLTKDTNIYYGYRGGCMEPPSSSSE